MQTETANKSQALRVRMVRKVGKNYRKMDRMKKNNVLEELGAHAGEGPGQQVLRQRVM